MNLTNEDNPIDEISRIEAQLEELAEVSERCRKIILVSKAAIAGGVALMLFMMLGLFGSNQVTAIGSIAVVLGGIVSLGSNASTLQQAMAAMSAAEALRADMISRIDLAELAQDFSTRPDSLVHLTAKAEMARRAAVLDQWRSWIMFASVVIAALAATASACSAYFAYLSSLHK